MVPDTAPKLRDYYISFYRNTALLSHCFPSTKRVTNRAQTVLPVEFKSVAGASMMVGADDSDDGQGFRWEAVDTDDQHLAHLYIKKLTKTSAVFSRRALCLVPLAHHLMDIMDGNIGKLVNFSNNMFQLDDFLLVNHEVQYLFVLTSVTAVSV